MSEKDISKTLDLAIPLVRKNLKVVSREDFKYPCLLHVAASKQQRLVPNISTRRMDDEDNTLPRVHCSTSLLGCILGYGAVLDNHYFGRHGKDEWFDLPKGGYYIYFINFDYCAKPNKNLVPDVEKTDEHWLFTYNENTVTYSDFSIGKMFATEMSITNTIDSEKIISLYFYVEVPKGCKLVVSEDCIVEEGNHKLKLTRTTSRDEDIPKDRLEVIAMVDTKEYLDKKKGNAALLSRS